MNEEIELQELMFNSLIKNLLSDNDNIINEITTLLKPYHFIYHHYDINDETDLYKKLHYLFYAYGALDLFFHSLFKDIINLFPNNLINDMLNAYPIHLLHTITKCNYELIYLTTDILKYLINYKKTYNIYLTQDLYLLSLAHPQLILQPEEIRALKLFLQSNKHLFINILINLCYEINWFSLSSTYSLNQYLTLCKSSWFQLVLFIVSVKY